MIIGFVLALHKYTTMCDFLGEDLPSTRWKMKKLIGYCLSLSKPIGLLHQFPRMYFMSMLIKTKCYRLWASEISWMQTVQLCFRWCWRWWCSWLWRWRRKWRLWWYFIIVFVLFVLNFLRDECWHLRKKCFLEEFIGSKEECSLRHIHDQPRNQSPEYKYKRIVIVNHMYGIYHTYN